MSGSYRLYLNACPYTPDTRSDHNYKLNIDHFYQPEFIHLLYWLQMLQLLEWLLFTSLLFISVVSGLCLICLVQLFFCEKYFHSASSPVLTLDSSKNRNRPLETLLSLLLWLSGVHMLTQEIMNESDWYLYPE